MRRWLSGWLIAVLWGSAAQLGAQDGPAPPPTYAAVVGANYRPLDAMRRGVVAMPPKLSRKVTLVRSRVLLQQALLDIATQAGLGLSYGEDLARSQTVIAIDVSATTAADALAAAVRGAGWAVFVNAAGQVTVVKAVAQENGAMTGRVTDAGTGQGIGAAEVLLAGTSLRTSTVEGGEFRLTDVPPGRYTLLARRIGYAARQQAVTVADGRTVEVTIALSARPTVLSELVTTATGDAERYKVGNSIVRIRADSTVARAPVRDLGDLVAGRAAGVQVMFPNGVAGQAPHFRIRGVNSITVSNDPIVIVDGIRVENSPARLAFDFRGAIPTTGRLADLNPEEIETVEVVKGPSAATLYGTDAANGVIVISTRRGRASRPEWTAYTEQGVSEVDVDWPANYYAWGHNTTTGAVQQCLLVARAAGTCAADSLTTFNPLRDAPNSPLGTGHRQQYGLQVAAGSAAFRYFLAGELEDETGYLRLTEAEEQFLQVERGGATIPDWQVRPNALRKVSLRANVGATLGRAADVNVTAGFVRNRTRLPNAGILQSAAWGRGTADTLTQWGPAVRRPAYAFLDQQVVEVTRFTAGLSTTWRVRPWLTSRASLGIDFADDDFSLLVRRGESPSVPLGRRLQQDQNITFYTADVGASAAFAVSPAITGRTSVGGQYTRRTTYTTGALATGLPPGASTVGGAAVVSGFESGAQTAIAGGYLEQAVGFRERLFLVAALRVDGASSFGREFRAAAYPKAGLSWLVLDGAGAAPLGLSTLRLRVAYGASGVQPSPIAALARDTVFTSVVNGTLTNGAALIAVGNPNLRAERQREVEAGLDLEAAGGRVRLEFTAYHRQSSDAIIDQPFANAFGLGRAGVRPINIGVVRNRGLEGLLAVRVVQGRALSWDVGLNGSVNQNRLLRLAPDVPTLGARTFRQVAGYPIHGIWDPPILGYADANGNGLIEPTEVTLGDTAVFFGPLLPTRQLTATTTVGLFGDRLRVSALFDYRGGHIRWNNGEGNRCNATIASCAAVNDPTAPLDRQAAAVVLNQTRSFVGYFEDGSYVTFRELSISYASGILARAIGARTAVLTLSGRNLVRFTDYSGIDPEGTNNPGTDAFADNPTAYPARYFIARVTLGY